MTQELDKEGLRVAIEAGRNAYHGDFCIEYIVEKAIQAYFSHPKETRNETR